MSTQIFIWNIIILVLSIVFIVCIRKFMDNIGEYYLYGIIVKANKYFVLVSILFSIMMYRTGKYFNVISNITLSKNSSILDIVNALFSFVPFCVNFASFCIAVYVIFNVYKEYYFEKRTSSMTYCSFKTLKIINRFSNLNTDYYEDVFSYADNNGGNTLLKFSFPTFIYVCYHEYFRHYFEQKHNDKVEDRKNEEKLYKTLISDIEKIRKENEKEAEKYMNKAKENLNKIK